MLRLGCEGVESQYISVVWEEKKKIRLLERRRRRLERKKRQSVPEGKNIYRLRRVPERKEGSTPFGQTHRLVFHKRTK